jgi:signal transduction histidine kinase
MVTDHRGLPDRWMHDLKNQLGIILGFSELLLEDMPADDPARPDILEILAAAQRAMEIVETGPRAQTGSE